VQEEGIHYVEDYGEPTMASVDSHLRPIGPLYEFCTANGKTPSYPHSFVKKKDLIVIAEHKRMGRASGASGWGRYPQPAIEWMGGTLLLLFWAI
jgi:hypothetical protein